MTPQQLLALSLLLAAAGLLLWAGSLFWRLRRSAHASHRVQHVLQQTHSAKTVATNMANAAPFPGFTGMPSTTSNGRDNLLLNPLAGDGQANTQEALAAQLQAPAWLDTGVAKALLAEEDRKLLDQAGVSLRTGSALFVASRAILAIALPLLGIMLLGTGGTKTLMVGFFGFGLGIMLPKWYVRSKAARRRNQVVEELPLFVDLLRLLQGVGLSIDQSLQILATEFGSVLRVLSGELRLANQLYANGRTREQSFQRLANLSADDDMTAVVSLLVQVDRHGGAVQEPLNQFGIRLREKRQASFKEKIGQITVKMTGVMVLTLLPALLVITAGPGFMAVIRSLSKMGGQ
ncbi:type II secretion system F family protein [Lampropedia puyangensis]|uniref:Type II secretion system F family protein n=1 Tax=Lampropedia puyangensis TaxID=1330072 RepID=A0A4S8F119_9BURK|nr:type II secretion system F family protein [Lampropedia puyangensis]THT99964.1 type II secretion system F family protein [Lampropedia puyangensis]